MIPSWLDFLARDRLAWQSFDVLDDLVLGVDALQLMVAGEAILEPLLARAIALRSRRVTAFSRPNYCRR